MSRPEILYPLFSDASSLSGVGPQFRANLERLIGTNARVQDLLWHLPVGIIDRRQMPSIHAMEEGQIVTCLVEVQSYHGDERASKYRKTPFRVTVYNETGFMDLVFFQARIDYLKKILPLKERRVISGKIERYQGKVQMMHPDYIAKPEELESIRNVEPVYPLVAGITSKLFAKLIKQSLQRMRHFPEWLDPSLIQKYQWPSWSEALTKIHQPQELHDINPDSPHRNRLAYDELLANQLALKLARNHYAVLAGQSIQGDGALRQLLLAQLPFTLTAGQESVIQQIYTDQIADKSMLRLLQGDVGSGKTVVALLAMLHAIEAGKQAALMVPTEVLARQHYQWISKVTASLPIKVAFLGGSIKGKEKERILEALANGEIHLVIGTHALFQEKVSFRDLGIAIIDEQHRFGVEQRVALTNKGKGVDTLLMTATPIPRTLTLAMYGDMECSFLKDKPKGRKPIDTRMMSSKKEVEVIQGFERVLARHEKIYWICPLIEISEKIDLAAAQTRYTILQQYYPGQVGLLHGKMPTKEREAMMESFSKGAIHILVATTVVEVGVDVPDATVIVIEHAERFGLSQLHQLRGRVGRSDKQSVCILLYEFLHQTSLERLRALRASNDGFWLAEEDLRLRGAGEMLGVKQSGVPEFKLAQLDVHQDLLKIASQDAKLILHQDPNLSTPRGKALQMLLHLFDYDTQMRYLQAG